MKMRYRCGKQGEEDRSNEILDQTREEIYHFPKRDVELS